MATRVTLETLDDQIVVQKVALAGDRADRRAEAVWLAEAHHQGVVRFLRLTEEPLTIVTEHAGTDTMRTRHLPPTRCWRTRTNCGDARRAPRASSCTASSRSDHIVLHDGHRTSARLCSPRGDAIDPTDDLVALGTCVSQLLERWDQADTPVPDRTTWFELANRLQQDAGPYGMQRAASALAGLSQPRTSPAAGEAPPPSPQTVHRDRRRCHLLVPVPRRAAGHSPLERCDLPAARPRYRHGTLHHGRQRRHCRGDQHTVPGRAESRDPRQSSRNAGGFFEGRDGEQARALATVPGATNVERRDGPHCDELWLTGPAGEHQVVPAAD
ncbi:MAG: hypothetical protein R2706_15615 [Acidimicrobiales bacterium]